MINKAESNLRQRQERREHEFLSQYAAFSDKTAGRDIAEIPCDIRPEYQRDRDRILHSKTFRRLKGKTQVFLFPEGDHYRTRMTHTLEVSQTARTIAKALRLNEDLAEAIALGHDLGHTPFGHAGERALNRVCDGGFRHHLQSIRIVEKIEKNNQGLNLTKEVRDGIKNHQTVGNPSTLEGKIVRIADKIAYINHDIDDAIRGHIITEEDLPYEYTSVLGHSVKERLNTLIHDIIMNSDEKNDILMSTQVEAAMTNLRKYMFKNVYTNPLAKGQEQKAESMIEQMFHYYTSHLELLPEEYLNMASQNGEEVHRVVCDYIAGMTDHYAVSKYREIMIPTSWDVY